MLEGCGLGIGISGSAADVGCIDDAEALGVGGHDAVLDPVVDHLDEVPCTGRAAVEPPLLGRRRVTCATRRSRGRVHARRQVRKHRCQQVDGASGATDHEAVAALLAPDPTAGPGIDPLDAFGRDFRGSTQIIVVVRVPAVDDHVAFLKERHKVIEHRVDDACRHHQPDGSRCTKPSDEGGQVIEAGRTASHEACNRFGIMVGHHEIVTACHESLGHARAHPSKPDHAQLHRTVL